jgi:hypothetical protein
MWAAVAVLGDMKRRFLSFQSPFIVPVLVLLASCSSGRELGQLDGGAGGEVQTSFS